MDNFPTLKTAPKKNAAATKSNNSNKKNNNSQQHVYAAAQDYFSNKQKLQQQQQQQDQSQFCIRNSLATGALSSTMDQYNSNKIISQVKDNNNKKMPAKKKTNPSLKKNGMPWSFHHRHPLLLRHLLVEKNM